MHNGDHKEPIFKEFTTFTFIEILKQKDFKNHNFIMFYTQRWSHNK